MAADRGAYRRSRRRTLRRTFDAGGRTRARRVSVMAWRRLAKAIAAAACCVRCTPHPVDALVRLPADASDATPDVDAGADDEGLNDTGPLVWPNAGHTANSDPWIAQNHDRITVMKPQVLLLDFANEFDQQDGGLVEAGYDIQTTLQELIKQHVEAFEVASQYQGYKNPNAPAFLQYQVDPSNIIDLRDDNGKVNSSKLP